MDARCERRIRRRVEPVTTILSSSSSESEKRGRERETRRELTRETSGVHFTRSVFAGAGYAEQSRADRGQAVDALVLL